jgi:hypothetical protein
MPAFVGGAVQRMLRGLEFGERFVDVLDFKADVIESAFTFGDHICVLAVGRRARDELDHRLADRIECKLDGMLGELFDAAQRNAEAVLL